MCDFTSTVLLDKLMALNIQVYSIYVYVELVSKLFGNLLAFTNTHWAELVGLVLHLITLCLLGERALFWRRVGGVAVPDICIHVTDWLTITSQISADTDYFCIFLQLYNGFFQSHFCILFFFEKYRAITL